MSVLGRANSLLGCFTPFDKDVTLSELARRSGLPKATAHRLSSEMVELGLLERGSGGLHLGVRLFELGWLAPRPRTVREIAQPAMMHLRTTTRHTVHLGVLIGTEVVYVDKRAGDVPLKGLPSRIGGRMPAHATALGKALLAHAPAPQFDDAPRLTPRTLVRGSQLAKALDDVRVSGVAFDRQEAAIGFQCVASIIQGQSGVPIGALSLSGPLGTFDPDAYAATVRSAAASVSSRLQRLTA